MGIDKETVFNLVGFCGGILSVIFAALRQVNTSAALSQAKSKK